MGPPRVHYVVACGAAKLPHPAPAHDLYTSSHFAYMLRGATAAAKTTAALGVPAAVWILSARHGLVHPGTVLAPYDTTIGDPDAVTATLTTQARRLGLGADDELRTLLPRAYRQRLSAAAADLEVTVTDLFAGTRGIGDQRHVAATLLVAADATCSR